MTKKRLLLFLLTVSLLLSLCSTVWASGTVISTDLPGQMPDVGKTFTVTVSVSGNTGIGALNLTMEFNDDVLDCTGVKAGTVTGKMLSAANPDAEEGAIFAAAAVEPAVGDGTLAEFSFKVLASGNMKLKLTDIVCSDSDGKELSYTLENATSTPRVIEDKKADVREQEILDEAVEEHIITKEDAKNSDKDYTVSAPATRAQAIVMLWRMAGSPKASGTSRFTDVKKSAWYFEAVLWAEQNAIVDGMTDTTFCPELLLTREQAATVLFRYNGNVSGMESMFTETYDKNLSDSAGISDWAKNAVYWAVYNGYLSQTGGSVDPRGQVTRAEFAALLLQYN